MPKKIPQRTCMGCQTKKDKRDLVRIVRSPAGEISVDLTGKKPGRGAYICHDLECLNKVFDFLGFSIFRYIGSDRGFNRVDARMNQGLFFCVTTFDCLT